MKRISCLLVVISMVLALASCQAKEDKIVCEECGESILQSSNYCSNCGSKIFGDENTPNTEDILTEEEKKFVGTYEESTTVTFYTLIPTSLPGISSKSYKNIPVNEKMVLNKDGTGTFERRFSNKITDAYYGDIVKDFKFDVDDLHSTYNIKWTVVDGYVVIQFSGYNYYPQSSNYETIYVSDGEPDEFSKTYELRANKMFDIDQIGDTAQFTKID